MQTEQVKKKCGPCTKQEQTLRRDKVYRLYFEQGFSAVQIANELGINRNTANDDIRYWTSQIATQYGKENLGIILARQIEMLENQRKRLLDSLESLDFEAKHKTEKLIFEIDYKIASFVTKIGFSIQQDSEIIDEVFCDVVKDICLSGKLLYPENSDEVKIKKATFAITASDTKYVRDFFNLLMEKGLSVFSTASSGITYDLMSFAVTKSIITDDERREFFKKRKDDDKKLDDCHSKIERKFMEKFGPDMSKWSIEVKDQMEEEMF